MQSVIAKTNFSGFRMLNFQRLFTKIKTIKFCDSSFGFYNAGHLHKPMMNIKQKKIRTTVISPKVKIMLRFQRLDSYSQNFAHATEKISQNVL